MKITLKFYFDDGSEIETDLLSENILDPSDPDDEPYDQEAIKANIPDVSFSAFLNEEQFFQWLEDPSCDVFFTDLMDESGNCLSARKSKRNK